VGNFFAIYGESLAMWLPPLMRAARVTLLLAVLSIAVGAVVGLLLALLKMGGSPLFRRAASFYIEVTRGTPALAQLYIAYFGLASMGVTLDNATATIVALGLNAAAYMAEIYRAGIESVHGGQREAALSLGMTPSQALRFIVLPQAWRVVLPPAANLGIAVLKDTSLASAIATPDLMSRAYDLVGQTWRPMHIYLLVAVMYMAMCLPLAQVVRRLERGVKRSDVPAAKTSGSVGWRARVTAA
jgi:polar amino acid transport system permease protein